MDASTPRFVSIDKVRRLGLITRPQLPLALQVPVPTTQNSSAAAVKNPTYYQKLLDGPALLYSYAISSDANTKSNFVEQPSITTSGTPNIFTGSNNLPLGYMPFPNGGAYNPIPEGTALFLPGSTVIALYVYYTGSSGTAGSVDISIALDVLGNNADLSNL